MWRQMVLVAALSLSTGALSQLREAAAAVVAVVAVVAPELVLIPALVWMSLR